MKATNWEFKNRAVIFGLIIALGFLFYFVDPQNASAALANRLAPRLGINADALARILFALAAVVLIKAALLRTWASAYLHSDVVYAADIQTRALVADGPYRHVCNPLYFANLLMAIGMGAMASRVGFFVLPVAMLLFCYRLILREEAELRAVQGASYDEYQKAVPRLWPALRPRVPAGQGRANWAAGFKAESWYWGFAAALVVFAITLKFLGLSLASFWFLSSKKESQPGT
jgi:protein-S-isoprenylcysteine O-methyltransferase Ste14